MNIFSTYNDLDQFEYLASNGKTYQYTIQNDIVKINNFKITANFVEYILNEHEWRRDQQILIKKVIDWLRVKNQGNITNSRFELHDGISSMIITTSYYVPVMSTNIDVFLSQDIVRV
jgi:hypothetical protein